MLEEDWIRKIVKIYNPLVVLRDIEWLKWQAYKRNNPVGTDQPFFYSSHTEVKAGETKTFKMNVKEPRKRVYFLRRVDFSFYSDTEYRLSKDGKNLIVPMLTYDVKDGIIFEPPIVVKKYLLLRITNKSDTDRTYNWFCSGWKRFK